MSLSESKGPGLEIAGLSRRMTSALGYLCAWFDEHHCFEFYLMRVVHKPGRSHTVWMPKLPRTIATKVQQFRARSIVTKRTRSNRCGIVDEIPLRLCLARVRGGNFGSRQTVRDAFKTTRQSRPGLERCERPSSRSFGVEVARYDITGGC